MLAAVLAVFANGEAFAADQPSKVALVIGNAGYPDSDLPLKEAVNDARDVADELRHDGFDVDAGVDLAGDAMRQALDRLYSKIGPGSAAVIFFDGFAIQSGRQTYLIPVDAQIWTEADVLHDGFNLETILGEINSRGARVKIALLDASRRNPYERRFRRYSAGLAPAVTPGNTMVLYSTALGSVSSDNKSDHGLFVTELLREIRAPGVSAEQALRNTQVGVIAASRGEQVPWLSSSLTTYFSLTGDNVGKIEKAGPCETVQPEQAQSPEQLARDPVISELTRRIAANGADQISYYKRGQVYAVRRAYGLAVRDFNEVIRLRPGDVEAYNNRCWTLAAIGDLLPALRDCEEALRLSPGLADALDSRGLVNLKLGKTAEAISDYSEALVKNPRSASSLYGRGIAKRRKGTDGSLDLNVARSIDPGIAREFAGYGISECGP